MPALSGVSAMQDVAITRARESDILWRSGHRLGAVYLQGYNIECLLKYLLHLRGVPFPSSGSEGHNLRGLWASAFPSQPARGHGVTFLTVWSTNLRYEAALPVDHDAQNLMLGAKDLAARITSRIRNENSRKSRRGARKGRL